MVFKRRDRPPFWMRLREWISPRKGWRRGFEYLGHRVKRIPDSPHRIAIGFAAGAFVSFSPLFGFHFFLAALLAWIVRGNVLAGLIGTIVGNPLTFPAIAAGSLGLGRLMLGGSDRAIRFEEVTLAFSEAFSAIWHTTQTLWGQGAYELNRLDGFLNEVFLPYAVGGLVTGGICAVLTYFICRPIVAAYQSRRRLRLMERAREQVRGRFRKTVAKPDPAE